MMPFLNGGAAFAPAIRSIQSQTHTNWELLLCDDGSTDGSLEIARQLSDPRIKVWSDGKRRGLAYRLNECIERAQGEMIARMDADDISFPHRIGRQVAFMARHPEIDVVGCPMVVFGEDGKPLGKRMAPLEHERIIASPSLGFGLAHPTWMARACWYKQHRYDATAIRYEDAELLYRTYPNSRFANLPDILYGYRELRGGFAKRLKTRIGRVRYLRARRGTFGLKLLLSAAAAESAKALSDAVIALTGARYAMLRLREERLSEEDLRAWNQVMA
jgi:glycosyltransferase involved in cell wall biosynthesis